MRQFVGHKLRRSIFAALIAPFVLIAFVPPYYRILNFLSARPPAAEDTLAAGFVLAAFMVILSYPGMLVIGVPAYLFFDRRGRATWWAAAIVGALVALIEAMLLELSGVVTTPITWALLAHFAWSASAYCVPGALVGIVFWLLVRERRAP